jgi:hypothetical protein
MRSSIFTLSACVAFTAAAFADTPIPHQKVGLWQTSMKMMGQDITSQSCIDAASEAKMNAFSTQLRNKNCKASQITHNIDGSWTSVSTCEFSPGQMHTTKTTVTGDFNSKFTAVMHTDRPGAKDMTMTSTWLGACKPGMKGGDVIMSNGMKMNMTDGH